MGYRDNDTCLAKVAPDEPIFVLRAQDRLADGFVDDWADAAEFHGCDPDKVREARECADAMRKWPTRKWPD